MRLVAIVFAKAQMLSAHACYWPLSRGVAYYRQRSHEGVAIERRSPMRCVRLRYTSDNGVPDTRLCGNLVAAGMFDHAELIRPDLAPPASKRRRPACCGREGTPFTLRQAQGERALANSIGSRETSIKRIFSRLTAIERKFRHAPVSPQSRCSRTELHLNPSRTLHEPHR